MKSVTLQLITLLLQFNLSAQVSHPVIISEIMADPTPVTGLPAVEWIELQNVSSLPISLHNWRIGDLQNRSGPIPDSLVLPGEQIIICGTTAATLLRNVGKVAAVTGFPSLDNAGDVVYLVNNHGQTIHAIAYSDEWYQNTLKQQGGWSLEMIDTNSPCLSETNWAASVDAAGGSPGKPNTVNHPNQQNNPPTVQHAFMATDSMIVLVFDIPVDSLSASQRTNYIIDHTTISGAEPLPPLFTTVALRLSSPLQPGVITAVKINSLKSCQLVPTEDISAVRIGLPASPVPGDWVINEVLFNPAPGGSDYLEILNRSTHILDAGDLFVANKDANGQPSSIQDVDAEPHYVFPGEYRVLTSDVHALARQYHVKYPGNVIRVPAMPSMPDDEGIILLLDKQGNTIDELSYNHSWHFPTVTNEQGVSLERIDAAAATGLSTNWTSAASTAGFGTPGYVNSQTGAAHIPVATVEIDPALFSPDNDGDRDFTRIYYTMIDPGYMGTVQVFNSNGQLVRSLAKNVLLGVTGYWHWDGLDDRQHLLPPGIYIVLACFFNDRGKRDCLKRTVTLLPNR